MLCFPYSVHWHIHLKTFHFDFIGKSKAFHGLLCHCNRLIALIRMFCYPCRLVWLSLRLWLTCMQNNNFFTICYEAISNIDIFITQPASLVRRRLPNRKCSPIMKVPCIMSIQHDGRQGPRENICPFISTKSWSRRLKFVLIDWLRGSIYPQVPA